MVYNLEVRELHNFLVGESGVVVHNSCSISNTSNLPDPPLEVKPLFEDVIQKNTKRSKPDEFFVAFSEILTDAQGKKIFNIKTPPNKDFVWRDKGSDTDGFDFIIKQDGTLLMGKGHGFMAEHKSVSELGEPILAAGKLVIDKNTGRLKRITPESGHYQPNPSQFDLIEQKFIDEGLLYFD